MLLLMGMTILLVITAPIAPEITPPRCSMMLLLMGMMILKVITAPIAPELLNDAAPDGDDDLPGDCARDNPLLLMGMMILITAIIMKQPCHHRPYHWAI
uniref:Putative secreted protein n=1 Tax=Anopheles darlingi TaxID=43151 RepID=A0A2M4D194_ANODA